MDKKGIKFFRVFKIAYRSLNAHKLRSALTILGIVIGISSVMTVMSIGNGARDMIVDEIQSFWADAVIINPGNPEEGFAGMGEAFLSTTLTNKDFEDLSKKANIPDAKSVTASVTGSVNISYESETFTAVLFGSSASVFDAYYLEPKIGNKFTKGDVRSKANVVLIGERVAEELFNGLDPLDKKIRIKDKKFKVIGVLSSDTGSAFFDVKDIILTPYTSAQQYILGTRHFQEIIVQATSKDKVPYVVKDVKRMLRENHNISEGESDDFFAQTIDDAIDLIDQVIGVVTAFIAIVAGVSIVVGGVGIMNIMWVSVNERTREIGLRKAVGATNKDIRNQFLVEAVILTLGGGILGIAIGFLFTIGAVQLINNYLGEYIALSFSVTGAVVGVVVSVLIGLIFGMFPAKQASKLDPITALRYE